MHSEGQIEDVEDLGKDDRAVVRRWCIELDLSQKEFKDWDKRGRKIIERYKDERKETDSGRGGGAKYNVLWSNVNTMQPSLYSRTPKPEVERRFKDGDPIGRAAAQILERATDYAVKAYDFDSRMKQVRDDYLLVGRGTAWVRYVPYINQSTTDTRLVEEEDGFYSEEGSQVDLEGLDLLEDEAGFFYQDSQEEVVYEEVACDYIHWQDFYHSPARTWDEVRWVAKRVFMTKEELREEFGDELAKQVPLNHKPQGGQFDDDEMGPEHEMFKRAVVYEIWNKEDRKVYWICPDFKNAPLLVEDDPLQLRGFFPCPRPLLSTVTNDSLVPVPDYSMYQDQAKALDILTQKIESLTKAIKVAGVYNGANEELKDLLEQGQDLAMYPVEDWYAMAETGGLQGSMDFLPIQEIASALQVLVQQRELVKSDLYEITGISDIIRGSTSPSETATAQQIKGQFATLRLADRQGELQRFARDLIALKAEIIAEHFSEETIALMSGTEFIDDQGTQINFPQAVALLRDDALRTFRVDIETDSTIAIDDGIEKQNRSEFLHAVGQFFSQSQAFAESYPETLPIMSELLLFGVRGYKVGRNLETALEQFGPTLSASVQQRQQAQSQQQDPRMMEIQINAQAKQAELQLQQQSAQSQAMIKQFEAKMKEGQMAFEQGLKVRQQQFEQALAQEKMKGENGLKAYKINQEMQIKAAEAANQQQVDTQQDLKQESQPLIVNIDNGGAKAVKVSRDPLTGDLVGTSAPLVE